MVSSISLNQKISQDSSEIYAADAGGIDAYVIALTPTLTAYAAGQVFSFKANTANTGAATLNIDGIGAKAILKKHDQVLDDGDIEAGQVATVVYDGVNFQLQSPNGSADGILLQMVNVTDGAVATGVTAMPTDDTIPQITEGDEYMTLAVTPANVNNLLKIDVCVHLSPDAGPVNVACALFQDATAGALAATGYVGAANAYSNTIYFTHYMIAGTVAATTFRLRAGTANGSQLTFNGQAAARRFGGVSASSITIQEFRV